MKISEHRARVEEARRIKAEAEKQEAVLAESIRILDEEDARLDADARKKAVEQVHAELAAASEEFVTARDEALEQLAKYHESASSGVAIYDRLVGLKSREALLLGSDVTEGHFELPPTGTQEMGANPRYREIARKMGVPLTGANAQGDGS